MNTTNSTLGIHLTALHSSYQLITVFSTPLGGQENWQVCQGEDMKTGVLKTHNLIKYFFNFFLSAQNIIFNNNEKSNIMDKSNDECLCVCVRARVRACENVCVCV